MAQGLLFPWHKAYSFHGTKPTLSMARSLLIMVVTKRTHAHTTEHISFAHTLHPHYTYHIHITHITSTSHTLATDGHQKYTK